MVYLLWIKLHLNFQVGLYLCFEPNTLVSILFESSFFGRRRLLHKISNCKNKRLFWWKTKQIWLLLDGLKLTLRCYMKSFRKLRLVVQEQEGWGWYLDCVCKPSIALSPEFEKAKGQFWNDDIVFLSIWIEKEKWINYTRNHKANYQRF